MIGTSIPVSAMAAITAIVEVTAIVTMTGKLKRK